MDKLPHAVKRIRTERRLRASEITPDVLRSYYSGLGEETLEKLLPACSTTVSNFPEGN